MKLKIMIAVVAVAYGSTAIAGPGCKGGHKQQVQTCAAGSVWDSQSGTCVPQINS